MKKIFILFLLILPLFSAEKSLQNIIKDIAVINKQLYVIHKNDDNKTNLKQEIQRIEQKKQDLISQIPSLIRSSAKEFYELKDDFQTKSKKLQYRIGLNEKSGYKNAVTRDIFTLKSLEAFEEFSTCMLTIKDSMENPNIKDDITASLDETLLSLKTIMLPTINTSITPHKNDYSLNELYEDEFAINSLLNTYIEILEFLRANSNLLKSNFILSMLDFSYAISYINHIMPFSSNLFNFGKTTFCLIVLLFGWSVVRIVKKRNKLLMPFLKSQYAPHKDSIIKSTNLPIITLIMTLSIHFCFDIIYHPFALSPKIAIIFSIIYTLIITWFVISVSKAYSVMIIDINRLSGNFRKDVVNLILKIFYFIVMSISFLVILGKLGVNVSAIIASLGIGGLAVAWASKDILANFFSSILLLIDNSFSQGDCIVCGSVEGTVVEIGLRKTTIRTSDNALLFVPNQILANDPIRNWSRRKLGRRIQLNIGVTYNSSYEQLKVTVDEIKQMLLNHPKIANPNDKSFIDEDAQHSYRQHVVSVEDLSGYKRALMVYLDEFSDSSINILVYCFSKTVVWDEWLAVKQDVLYEIMKIIEKNGLSFAFPSQSLYVESMPNKDQDLFESFKPKN